ncbi:MAG: ABC transporter substrate-binding protein, partial [Thermoprotei archaeon]
MKKFKTLLSAFLLIVTISGTCFSSMVLASSPASLPSLSLAQSATLVYNPAIPVNNQFSPAGYVGLMCFALPLAGYNEMNGRFLPVLASNWTMNASAKTLTIYIRKGLYWYNGFQGVNESMPFTAWDVYAYFYIGNKAFMYYVPFLAQNSTGIKVLNNYTIQFKFAQWSYQNIIWMLTAPQDTPYAVYEPIIKALQDMNNSEAVSFGASNISKFVPPMWTLDPYYIENIAPPAVIFHLDPPYVLKGWDQVFPYHTWQYYSPTYEQDWGGNTQILDWMLDYQNTFNTAGWSVAQVGFLEKAGFGVFWVPRYQIQGLTINQTHYPWDIPEVRQALAYIFNRTAICTAWGYPDAAYPEYGSVPIPIGTYSTWPRILQQINVNYTYDPAKAASMLESLGFYQKNGIWYTPNGTELMLAIQVPSGFTDAATMMEVVANQLTAFGIPTKVYGDEIGTFTGTILPEAQYQAAWDGDLDMVPSALSAWVGLEGVWSNYPSFNPKAIWKFEYPNGTIEEINLTQWEKELELTTPGTPEYWA